MNNMFVIFLKDRKTILKCENCVTKGDDYLVLYEPITVNNEGDEYFKTIFRNGFKSYRISFRDIDILAKE